MPPPTSELEFVRENFKTPQDQLLNRFNEWAELLKKYNVDLIITHERAIQQIYALFCKLSGVKIIIQLHESIKSNLEFRFPYLASYPLADAVVVASRLRREFLKSYGINSFYIPNPVMIEKAEEFTGRNSKKVTNTILWVGRLSNGAKNYFNTIRIMKEVVEKITDAKLKIVGKSDDNDEFQKFIELVKENNLETNIELCGYHTDVAPFYKAADVMLNTSPHEGWSLVISESKFYELPLVLYKLPDNELTSDSKGCIAVPFGDSHAAAQAIIMILTNTNLRCKLSIQARESLQPFLDYDIAGAWQKIFESVENNKPAPPVNQELLQAQDILLEEILSLRYKL